jgi:hypothetical protein
MVKKLTFFLTLTGLTLPLRVYANAFAADSFSAKVPLAARVARIDTTCSCGGSSWEEVDGLPDNSEAMKAALLGLDFGSLACSELELLSRALLPGQKHDHCRTFEELTDLLQSKQSMSNARRNGEPYFVLLSASCHRSDEVNLSRASAIRASVLPCT